MKFLPPVKTAYLFLEKRKFEEFKAMVKEKNKEGAVK